MIWTIVASTYEASLIKFWYFWMSLNPADVCECSSATDTCCVSNSSMCQCKDGWTGRKCSTGKCPWSWGQSVFGKNIQDTNVIEECHVLLPTQFCQSHFSFTFSLNSGSPKQFYFDKSLTNSVDSFLFCLFISMSTRNFWEKMLWHLQLFSRQTVSPRDRKLYFSWYGRYLFYAHTHKHTHG